MTIKTRAAFAAMLFAVCVPAKADDYPSHSMTMVIPFAAGGPTDVLGRLVAGRMSEIMHQTVIVENINGAGGQTGSLRVANADPDGYEFVLATVGTHAQGQTLYQHPLYNAVTDFTPVILIANIPLALVARKDLPVNTFKEFVAYVKENQAKMQFGSAGTGSATHLGCLLMNYLLKVNVTHVPYRGSGPAVTDVMAGRIDVIFDTFASALPLVRGGQLRGLAVTSAKRFASAPEFPSIAEAALPGFDVSGWYALYVPAKTPPDIISKLNADVVAVLKNPEFRDRMEQLGVAVIGSTPEALDRHLRAEFKLWEPVVKAAAIKIE